MEAAAAISSFGTPLGLSLSVSQPHPHPQAGGHANAHAHSHAPAQTHALANPRASANAQIFADNHSFYSVRDAWRLRGDEAMAVYDDTEEHESDISRQGDESARSSSVTTPDIHVSRPPPPLPFDSKQSKVVDSSLEPDLLCPPEYQIDRVPRLSLSPPPPPPPPLNAPRSLLMSSQYPPPPPPPPPSQSNHQTRVFHFPPPPPPPGFDHAAFQTNKAMNRVPPPPPPPPPRSASPTESSDQDDQDSTPQSQGQYRILPQSVGKLPSIPTSDEKSHQSRRGRPRTRRRRRFRDHSSGSTYSRTRPSTIHSSDSGSTSGEDPIQYRNARHFPPRLPTAPTYGSPGTDSKTSINRITAWVADYEKTRSPRRQSLMEITAGSLPRGSDIHSNDGFDDGESDISSEGEIEMLWTQLKEKRTKLNDIKFQMTKRRKGLRELRTQKDDADNAFMSAIRPILVNHQGVSIDHVERQLVKMQTLRSDYHDLEASYENLELTLDEEEAQLNKLETRFFSLLAAGHTRLKRPQADRDPEQEQRDYFKNMPLDLKGISPHGPPEDRHPLYLELMDTVGDLENAKEEYEDLLMNKGDYSYVLEMNQTAGKPEYEGATEFLAEFPEQEQQMSGNITKFQEGVSRLKHICEDKGVMHKHMSARVEYLLYPENGYQDMDLEETESILQRPRDLTHSKFPMLLSQPQHVLAEGTPYTSFGALRAAVKLPDEAPEKREKLQLASKEYAIDNLIMGYDTDKKTDFIDRWLLQQLRTSPMNADLLHSTFVNKNGLKIRDFWRWQSDVLHYWWHDGGLAEEPFKPVTSEGSQGRVGTSIPSRAASDGNYRKQKHVRRHQRTNSSSRTQA